MKIDLRSLVAGALLGVVIVLSVAAATMQPPIPEISGSRFASTVPANALFGSDNRILLA